MAEYVAGNNYPRVVRLASPLLIRLDEMLLQVDTSIYQAKIKYGNAFKGFNIYVSGTNMPIYEENISESKLNNETLGYNNAATEYTTSESQRRQFIKEMYAKKWLDRLEEVIANSKESGDIKKAIDRLNWQLHYDITKSSTNLPQVLDDFSNVDIDKVTPTFKDMADNISGKLDDIDTSIVNFDNGTNNQVNGALIQIKRAISNDNEDSIYKALKGATGGSGYSNFSVVTALREAGELYSVAGATYQQTQLESAEFTDIDTRLGQPGTGNSIWDSVNTIDGNVGSRGSGSTVIERLGQPTSGNSIWNTVNKVDTNIGDTPVAGTTLFDIVGNPGSGNSIWNTVNNIDSHIGDSSSASGTVWKSIADVGSAVSGVASDVTSIRNSVGTTAQSGTIMQMLHNCDKVMNGDGTIYGYAYVDGIYQKVRV